MSPSLPTADPATLFTRLDDDLPLALFPVRLEARFLPDRAPTEIVVRVFPDEIHADAHDPTFTDTELVLAQSYWDRVWAAGGDAAAVAEARDWLAVELGPHRAVYVAWTSRPRTDPPAEGSTRAPTLRSVEHRVDATPGTARLLPARWAAFVETGGEIAGPFWAAEPVTPDLPVTPALVDLPPGADARAFLDAQGLDWMHDLAAAETAGMVVRIPLSALPPRPAAGYDRLLVLGVASGTDHDAVVRDLLAAHRYMRGLEFVPPGTPTNVTEDATDGTGALDVQALFDAEFAQGTRPRQLPDTAPGLVSAAPADALAATLGLRGETAADLAAAADDAAPGLAHAANAALWPATWGAWFTDPMSAAGDGAALLERAQLDDLRQWFVDFVRAEGPLPTLRVGRQPYGLLPVTPPERSDGGDLFERLESFLLDVFGNWLNRDAVPVLDPDATDVAPTDHVAEQASDVGAVYGATPHMRELRLRPVSDDFEDLTGLYDVRLGFTGLLCALAPKLDGTYATPEELETHVWYQMYVEHEAAARGADGVRGQIDALRALVDDLDEASGTPQEEQAALAIRTYINRFERQPDGDDDEIVTGDLLGIVSRHQGRVEDAQRYLDELGTHDELGTGDAPRLYTAGYGEEGTEVAGGVLVAPDDDDAAVADLSAWLEDVRADVARWQSGGSRPAYDVTIAVPLLRQVLQHAAASVARGRPAAGLEQGVARLRALVDTDGAAAIVTLERLLRGTLGLAVHRVDAWMTAFATERLSQQRLARPRGLQVGAYGWLVDLAPREGRATQGHIHAPSLDHATTAAVLRSGWSAFGTADAGSPLAVDLSAGRVRAARWLVEGVRSGQELGRLLGGRFERRLHDRGLDRYLDDVRAAVLRGAGQAGRPATRTVDGLLVARAYTDGIETTTIEDAVREELDPIVTSSHALRAAVDDTVADLDAVADVLVGQAVHSLLRGDAGVAAPTLAATGSGDSGLPALEFPATGRSGRPVTVRVAGVLGRDAVQPRWPGAAASVLAAVEPRLERWVGGLLGDPGPAGLGALDTVYAIDDLPDAPAELATVARAVRTLLGRIRPLSAADLATSSAPTPDGESRDIGDLSARVDAATARLPAGDPRLALLAQHVADHPEDTADVLIERLEILAGQPVPVLPVLTAGVPGDLAGSFATRPPAAGASTWLAQAAKVHPDLATFVGAAQLAELVAGRPLLAPALAQDPDDGGPWAGSGLPTAAGPHTAWCSVTGVPEAGPVAGFVVDAWTETIPTTRATTGIAVHFDQPSATAPNAVLLAVARAGQSFDLDLVRRCVGHTLTSVEYRALASDAEHPFLGQFLPAVYLPGDAAVLEAGAGT